jgi:hypothetical protein
VADAASKPCTGEVPTVEDALRRHAAESTFELCAQLREAAWVDPVHALLTCLPVDHQPRALQQSLCAARAHSLCDVNSTYRRPGTRTPGVVSITGGFTVSATETTFVAQLDVARQRFWVAGT